MDLQSLTTEDALRPGISNEAREFIEETEFRKHFNPVLLSTAFALAASPPCMKTMPGWFFAGLPDGFGAGSPGPDDRRLKGDRLKDVAEIMNRQGTDIDIG
jgi:hypothetical protein